MFEPEKKKNTDSIDELKKRLYTRGGLGKRFLRKGNLTEHGEPVRSSWTEAGKTASVAETKIKWSFFKKIFVASAAFFLAALFYASYQFFAGGNIVSSKNINLSIVGPSIISGGDEFSLQVLIENGNSVPLEFSNLLIEYPKGTAGNNASSTEEMNRISKDIGSIATGGGHEETIKLVLYGEENKQRDVKFTLEYRISGSNAIFTKDVLYPVRISSAPINLSLDAPREANAGQEITFKIKASSNAAKDVPNIILRADYPPGFLFKDSDPKPAYGNNVWKLGDFSPGSSRSIRITGTISGQEGEERTVRILSGETSSADNKSIGVVYNSVFHTIAIHRPFLDAQVYLNGDPSGTVSVAGGKEVRGEIVWKNNLPTRITDAVIILKLSGNALNSASVSSQSGFYNSIDGTISWDKNIISDFRVVEPGSTGRLPFIFTPTSFSPLNGSALISPQINMNVTVRGDVGGSQGNEGPVSVTTEKTVKISTDMQLLSRSMYYSGPFKNTGPIPPVAEKETTYTIYWTVTNSANNVSSASVKTTLPPYAQWMGTTYPANEDVSYDDNSRTVTWRMNTVYAGSGYNNPAREAAFQIKFLPSISHIGSSVSITGETSIHGTDTFAGVPISSSKNELTTALSGDTGFKEGDGVVVSPSK